MILARVLLSIQSVKQRMSANVTKISNLAAKDPGTSASLSGAGMDRLAPPATGTNNSATHGPIELTDPGAAPGVTRRYQYWFRTPGGPCSQMANLTNGYEINWLP